MGSKYQIHEQNEILQFKISVTKIYMSQLIAPPMIIGGHVETKVTKKNKVKYIVCIFYIYILLGSNAEKKLME